MLINAKFYGKNGLNPIRGNCRLKANLGLHSDLDMHGRLFHMRHDPATRLNRRSSLA